MSAARRSTAREAIATGRITMSADALAAIRDGAAKKGDVLAVARVAGIMAAKRTSDLIPLCHPLPLTRVAIDLALDDTGVIVTATAATDGKTGVEMEALTAVIGRAADDLRHGQGDRQGDGDRRRPPARKDRRQVRATGPRPSLTRPAAPAAQRAGPRQLRLQRDPHRRRGRATAQGRRTDQREAEDHHRPGRGLRHRQRELTG